MLVFCLRHIEKGKKEVTDNKTERVLANIRIKKIAMNRFQKKERVAEVLLVQTEKRRYPFNELIK